MQKSIIMKIATANMHQWSQLTYNAVSYVYILLYCI